MKEVNQAAKIGNLYSPPISIKDGIPTAISFSDIREPSAYHLKDKLATTDISFREDVN